MELRDPIELKDVELSLRRRAEVGIRDGEGWGFAGLGLSGDDLERLVSGESLEDPSSALLGGIGGTGVSSSLESTGRPFCISKSNKSKNSQQMYSSMGDDTLDCVCKNDCKDPNVCEFAADG